MRPPPASTRPLARTVAPPTSAMSSASIRSSSGDAASRRLTRPAPTLGPLACPTRNVAGVERERDVEPPRRAGQGGEVGHMLNRKPVGGQLRLEAAAIAPLGRGVAQRAEHLRPVERQAHRLRGEHVGRDGDIGLDREFADVAHPRGASAALALGPGEEPRGIARAQRQTAREAAAGGEPGLSARLERRARRAGWRRRSVRRCGPPRGPGPARRTRVCRRRR